MCALAKVKNIFHRQAFQDSAALNSSIREVYFDLDDTLIKNQTKFSNANHRCTELIALDLGFSEKHISNILDSFASIVKNEAESKPFHHDRTATSWKLTYHKLAGEMHHVISNTVDSRLQEIGNTVWEPPFELYEDVVETLDLIRTNYRFDELNILTLGDETLQLRKFNSMPQSVRMHFDNIYVVSAKNSENFAKIFHRHSPENYLMIGNSERCDVAPVLEIGGNVIHFPNKTWSFDEYPIDHENPRYHCIRKFCEIPKAIAGIG